MLKKKAVGGVQTFVKCEECSKRTKVLYDSGGKKVCKQCLENSGK